MHFRPYHLVRLPLRVRSDRSSKIIGVRLRLINSWTSYVSTRIWASASRRWRARFLRCFETLCVARGSRCDSWSSVPIFI